MNLMQLVDSRHVASPCKRGLLLYVQFSLCNRETLLLSSLLCELLHHLVVLWMLHEIRWCQSCSDCVFDLHSPLDPDFRISKVDMVSELSGRGRSCTIVALGKQYPSKKASDPSNGKDAVQGTGRSGVIGTTSPLIQSIRSRFVESSNGKIAQNGVLLRKVAVTESWLDFSEYSVNW